MADQPNIERHHHATLCVGGAQEDYDFMTKVLSLKNVKKTALYDGVYPIRHSTTATMSARRARSSRVSPCASPSARGAGETTRSTPCGSPFPNPESATGASG